MITVPTKTLFAAIEAILDSREHQAHKRGQIVKRDARQHDLDRIRALREQLVLTQTDALDAALVGILCGWATGSSESRNEMIRYLQEQDDPTLPSVEQVRFLSQHDVARMLELLFPED